MYHPTVFWCPVVSDEKLAFVTLTEIVLLVNNQSCCFQDFLFSFGFWQIHYDVPQCWSLCFYSFWICWAFGSGDSYIHYQIWKLIGHYFSEIYFMPFSLFSILQELLCICWYRRWCSTSLLGFFHLSSFFFLFFSDWLILVVLFSTSLIVFLLLDKSAFELLW